MALGDVVSPSPLLARGLPPGIVLSPTTDDSTVAATWLRGHGSPSIESVVAERTDQPYRPGQRGWPSCARLIGEAVIT
jgi:ATP-dependent DNA ligase